MTVSCPGAAAAQAAASDSNRPSPGWASRLTRSPGPALVRSHGGPAQRASHPFCISASWAISAGGQGAGRADGFGAGGATAPGAGGGGADSDFAASLRSASLPGERGGAGRSLVSECGWVLGSAGCFAGSVGAGAPSGPDPDGCRTLRAPGGAERLDTIPAASAV